MASAMGFGTGRRPIRARACLRLKRWALSFCLVSLSCSPLPQVELSGWSPVVQRQVAEAYEAAQADPRATGRLGMVLHTYDEYRPAAEAYQRAHELDPSDHRWPHLLGLTKKQQGHIEAAAEAFRSAIEADPYSDSSRIALARALLQLQRPADALQAVRDFQSPGARFAAGEALAGLGRHEEAIERYRQALRSQPRRPDWHYVLAVALRGQGDAEEAQRHFRLAEIYPEPPQADMDSIFLEVRLLSLAPRDRIQMAQSALRQGGAIESEQLLLESLEAHPESPALHANLITVYAALANFEKGDAVYRRAVSQGTTAAEIYLAYGQLLESVGRQEEASSVYQRAAKQRPGWPLASRALCRLYRDRGEYDEAEQHCLRAVEIAPRDRQSQFALAKLRLSQQRLEQAEDMLHRIIEPRDAESVEYQRALAAALQQQRRYSEALDVARQAERHAREFHDLKMLRLLRLEIRALERQNR